MLLILKNQILIVKYEIMYLSNKLILIFYTIESIVNAYSLIYFINMANTEDAGVSFYKAVHLLMLLCVMR